MKKLNYELKNLVARNKDGSYSTQSDRHRYLQLIARQLNELGFKHMSISSLKTKHVWALVRHWQSEISPFTCLLYTSPSPRDRQKSRMPSSA